MVRTTCAVLLLALAASAGLADARPTAFLNLGGLAGTTKGAIAFTGFNPAGRNTLSANDHTYKVHEAVPLYANKVGPFHNPSEVRLQLHTPTTPCVE